MGHRTRLWENDDLLLWRAPDIKKKLEKAVMFKCARWLGVKLCTVRMRNANLGNHLNLALTRHFFLHRKLLFNNDGELKKLGELLYMPKFAKTLERIRNSPDDFYNGELAKDIVRDIKDGGGIFTLDDLKNYRVKFRRPMNGTLGNYSWYSTPPPGSGVVLSFILNILKGISAAAWMYDI